MGQRTDNPPAYKNEASWSRNILQVAHRTLGLQAHKLCFILGPEYINKTYSEIFGAPGEAKIHGKDSRAI